MKPFMLIPVLVLTSLSAWAGPFVSEGPGPVATYLKCKDANRKAVFVVRSTAAVALVQGLYKSGSELVNMTCEPTPTGGWSCVELRAGGGLMTIDAERTAQGILIARVYRDNILGRRSFLKNLICTDGSSANVQN